MLFSASSRCLEGVELNDRPPPRLQLFHSNTIRYIPERPSAHLLPNLIDFVFRWRQYRYVFTADVTKMFRQVITDREDQHSQCILWRYEPTDPIRIYRLTSVTYGLPCSDGLASRTIKQLEADHLHEYPLGDDIPNDELYMDDALSVAHTISEALAE